MQKRIAACLLLLTLTACSNLTQPIPTQVPASIAVPTITATVVQMLAVTHLPPSETAGIESEATAEGQPAVVWNGIPIMPGATVGEGDEEGYVFTITATPQQVQEYYQLELAKLGWQPLSQESVDSSVTLLYMNMESHTLTVNILAKEHEVLVLLVKQTQ